MLNFVDIQHERVLDDREKWPTHFDRRMGAKLRLEKISGDAVLSR